MTELLDLVKWALPPIVLALAGAIGVMWRRLVQVQDERVADLKSMKTAHEKKYVGLLVDYHEVLRSLSASLSSEEPKKRPGKSGS